jgi:hypothetical protein
MKDKVYCEFVIVNAVIVKNTLFLDMTPYILLHKYRRFRLMNSNPHALAPTSLLTHPHLPGGRC